MEHSMSVDNTVQPAIERPFRSDEDFWRVRNLLIETQPITPTGFNWEVRRWDGWRFYAADPTWDSNWEKVVRLWETEEGKLVGAVHPEGTGDAHLELHPDYRHIEEDMIAWAEEHLAKPIDEGWRRQLSIFVFDYDAQRSSILEKRSYEKTPSGGVIRRLRFGNEPYPRPTIADGYTLRTTRPEDDSDCQRIADILNAAFNRDFHVAGEFRSLAIHAPCFRQDLDLVAVAPDGSFAAYVGAPYNEANRYGVFEPVCTHPDHQRKGLARTLMLEALHRIKALGATDVYVGTGDQIAANRLYNSIGFTETHKGHDWRRVF
jgi:GNAT superfamily N-acetyltransferase